MPAFFSSTAPIEYLFVDGAFLKGYLANLSARFFNGEAFDLDFTHIDSNFTKVFYYDAIPTRTLEENEEQFLQRIAPQRELLNRLTSMDRVHVYEGDVRKRRNKGGGLEQKMVDVILAVDNAQLPAKHAAGDALHRRPRFQAARRRAGSGGHVRDSVVSSRRDQFGAHRKLPTGAGRCGSGSWRTCLRGNPSSASSCRLLQTSLPNSSRAISVVYVVPEREKRWVYSGPASQSAAIFGDRRSGGISEAAAGTMPLRIVATVKSDRALVDE